ncbi:hypothetical protein V5799_008405 [Amblyomma americanum]|uniref:Ig-like domain-containing protein n=1 Tax=Amblyomma americanum TaxID=6943 RepID=A0AAQ4FEX8_AMBAM
MFNLAVLISYSIELFIVASTKAYVHSSDPPKIGEFKFPANLSPGDTVAVTCVVMKGNAGLLDLAWLKDDQPVEPTASLAVTSARAGPLSTLTIVDVSAKDSGNYTCVARNAAGSDRFTAHLAVTGMILASASLNKNSSG